MYSDDRHRDRALDLTPPGHQPSPLADLLLTPPVTPGRQGAADRARDLGILVTVAQEARFQGIKWLEDFNATDEQAALFVPRTVSSPALRWAQMMVLEYLCESYRVFDAHVVEVRKTTTGAYVWYFKGTCPHHRYPHSHNRWSLTQYANNEAFTVFRCFHDGSVRRLGYLPLDAVYLE